MKLMHLSDLHLGRRFGELSLLADQQYILEQILRYADEQKPNAALIAGDVYDKSVPSTEAVRLLDDFLTELSAICPIYLIYGNHDSAERLCFGRSLMEKSGVHLCAVYAGKTEPFVLEDGDCRVQIFLLPFFRPSQLRPFLPDEQSPPQSYTEAMQWAIAQMELDENARHVLVCHQFVAGSATCESEQLIVGGTDCVDSAVFAPFDYVALGHLHGPQRVGADHIRYCGTPLKYSFSEQQHQKSVTMVTIERQGAPRIQTLPLAPLHEMRTITGRFDEIISPAYTTAQQTEDYLRVILIDEQEVLDGIARLRRVYPNLLELRYDNARSRAATRVEAKADLQRYTPEQLAQDFYQSINGQALGTEGLCYLQQKIHEIFEEGAI